MYEFRWHQSEREAGNYEFQREGKAEWRIDLSLVEPHQVYTVQGPLALQVLRARKRGMLQGYFENALDFLERRGRGWERLGTAYHGVNVASVAPFLPATSRTWKFHPGGERKASLYADGIGIDSLKFRGPRGREVGRARYPRLEFQEAPGGIEEVFALVLYVVYVREKQFGVGR